MEIGGIIVSLFGTIILSVGGAISGVMEDVLSSLSMYGYNLETARAKGKQRISIKVGTIMYMVGVLITISGMVENNNDNYFIILASVVSVCLLILHYYFFIPYASRISMLATLKFYYFSRGKAMADFWEQEVQNHEWRIKLLTQLGFSQNMSSDELKRRINEIRVNFIHSTGPCSPSSTS
jgi:hypothetical protein